MPIRVLDDEEEISPFAVTANETIAVSAAPMSGLVQGTLVGAVVAVAVSALTATALYAYEVSGDKKPQPIFQVAPPAVTPPATNG